MKWISLAQTIMLALICVLFINFKTITTAGMIVFEIFIIASFILAVVIFVMQIKQSKKMKQETKSDKQ